MQFKEIADLKTSGLKKLLTELEDSRDKALDQIAFFKGKVETLENEVKRIYELIIDINKEEQEKESKELARLKEQRDKQKELEAFSKATRGVKTKKLTRKKDS